MNSRSLSTTIAALTMLVATVLGGCDIEGAHPLRIGTNIWPGYEPLYLARSLGYFRDTGVHLVEMPSASQVIQGIRSRTLEGGALTLDEALGLVADGIDLDVILIMDFSFGGDVLLAKPGIASIDALAGKTIAAETGAVGAILLNAALGTAGLMVDDVRIMPCPVDRHADCYADADAVVTFDPAASTLLKLGAQRLFDSREIPGQIVDVLVVRRDAVKAQPSAIRHLVHGYFQARAYLTAQPMEAATRMAPRLGIDADELLESFDGLQLPTLDENRQLLGGEPSRIEQTAADLVELLTRNGLLGRQVSTLGLASADFLPSGSVH
ncbi:MAG: ABC transporter substrate-binding protein [Gammaproteobacteria bacterium]|nr:ABC transporter substrate-binding protein [Gammaproteobacteria bacterium]